MTAAHVHYYRLFRRERPDRMALQCWLGAKRHVYFLADLKATLKAERKRSAAAKRGWRKRRTKA